MTPIEGTHGTTLAPWAIQRALARRNTPHPFAALDPGRTALVVIDLQRAYMHPDGGYLACPAAIDAVPAVNAMAQALRDAGGVVAWVQNTHTDACLHTWTVQQSMNAPESNASRNAALAPGSHGHALWPTLDVRASDLTVPKHRYSAFTPGTCDLERILRGRGVDTILVAGTLTNVCCDSTARDAMMLDFRTVMLSDACAAPSQTEHDAALSMFYATFGDVMDVGYATRCVAAPLRRVG